MIMTAAAWNAEYWFAILWIINALFGALAVAIFARASDRIRLSPLRRNILLSILAFHPYLCASTRAATFLPFMFPLAAGIVWATARPNRPNALLLGALSGFCVLTHGSYLILAPIALFYFKFSRNALLFFVSFVLIQTPWLARNYFASEGRVVATTGVGLQYWIKEADVNGPAHAETLVFQKATGRPLVLTYYGTVRPEDDALLFRLALSDVCTRPLAFIKRTALSAIFFWTNFRMGGVTTIFTFLLNAPLLLYLLFRLIKQKYIPPEIRFVLYAAVGLWGVFSVLAGFNTYFSMTLPYLLWSAFASNARPLVQRA